LSKKEKVSAKMEWLLDETLKVRKT